MDLAFAEIEIDVVVGKHARELLCDAFGFENDVVIGHGSLLLLVWNAICGGRGGFTDDAGQDEHGEDVGCKAHHIGLLQECPLGRNDIHGRFAC